MRELTARQLYIHLMGAHLMDAARPPLILDVRETWEYRIARLPGALHVPMAEVHARMEEFDRGAEIVVVCHHGIRSRKVAHFLDQNQFSRVINLSDGIDGWARHVDRNMSTY